MESIILKNFIKPFNILHKYMSSTIEPNTKVNVLFLPPKLSFFYNITPNGDVIYSNEVFDVLFHLQNTQWRHRISEVILH